MRSSNITLITAMTPLIMHSASYHIVASWVPCRCHARLLHKKLQPNNVLEDSRITRKKRRSSSYILAAPTETDSEASNESLSYSYSREELQKFTVKVLKEKLKLVQPTMKLSHFKLKDDLIDFLSQHYLNVRKDSESIALDHSQSTVSPLKNTTDSMRKRMVRLPAIDAVHIQKSKTSFASPKDAIFEQVFKRYPPLRELHSLQQSISLPSSSESYGFLSSFIHPSSIKSLSGLGDLDIRQTYHPIFSNLTSSDLDVVMVGTASCVPGVTRGVSCTALRLQWRRPETLNNYLNTPGTWIFDCGESTQVSWISSFTYCILLILLNQNLKRVRTIFSMLAPD